MSPDHSADGEHPHPRPGDKSFGRRSFLLGGAGFAIAGVGGFGRGSTAYAEDRALRGTAARAMYVDGTTLKQVATPTGGSGYRRLTAGPGYPLVVRSDLATGSTGRDERREALASIVQFTDLHLVDAQSPVRFEYLHEYNGSAFRPHEALGSHGAASLVERVNALVGGPFTGRAFDCVVATGDNTDNHEGIELDWFLTVMNGGRITQNTGDPDRWEGVQNGGDRLYWNPEQSVDDIYKQAGFPTIDGYLGRAMSAHTSPGLKTPWYSVFGNHDDSIQGVLPSAFDALIDFYTGSFKFTGFADPAGNAALLAAVRERRKKIISTASKPKLDWKVTPDERRHPFTPKEYIGRHLYADQVGPGPAGHGFDEEAAATGRGYYSFPIADGVVGIALDSTNRAGFTDGSIGDEQWRWLKRTLAAGNGTYFDGDTKHTHAVTDTYFVIFSHHTSSSMGNLMVDPAMPLDTRHSGEQLVKLLHDYPSVLAWVNGHTHVNLVTPQHHDDPRRSFWEINTASHIDFPQQARIIDVCDNTDGTLSLFTTLIESAAPYQASYGSGKASALAAHYRELSFNDLHNDGSREGGPADHNTELLLTDPLG